MSLITRFNGAFKAFASEATGTFRTVFGGTTQSNDLTDNLTNDFKTGWEIVGTNDEPTIEDFNAMGYTLSQVLAYIHQVGIIEWSGTDGVIGGQDYYANKSYVGYGGDIYVALLNSGGNIEARIPTNATYWKKVGETITTTINVASDADITLTISQNQYGRFVITDTGVLLTTTRNVIIGTAQKRFLVQNNTARSLVFKTSSGTGINVLTGAKADLYCDGTNVIEATNYTTDNQIFSAYANSAQVVTSGVATKINMNAEEFDTANVYDKDTNFRFQPTVAGYYSINATVHATSTANFTLTSIAIYKNGANFKNGDYLPNTGSTTSRASAEGIIYLNGTTDYVEAYAAFTSTGTVTVSAGTSLTYFQGFLARSA